MKRLLFITMAILLMARFGWAEPGFGLLGTEESKEEDVAASDLNECPHWKFKLKWNECKDCHLPRLDMALKEGSPDRIYNKPIGTTVEGEKVTYLLDSISPTHLLDFFQWVKRHPEFRTVWIEIHSPGGSLMDAKRILGIMNDFRADTGLTLTTVVRGWAASAGFYIFMNGDHRLVAPQAELMWHQLRGFDWFKINTPSSLEDEARIYRHLQQTVDEWIANRSNLTKEEIEKLTDKDEMWMNGLDALEYGFATGLLTE